MLIEIFLLAKWTFASAVVMFIGSWTFMIGFFPGGYVIMGLC